MRILKLSLIIFILCFLGLGANSSEAQSLLTRDLWLGIAGEDVMVLQIFLNNQGFVLAEAGLGSKGSETIFFGQLTKSALIRFQVANNIVPAIGYYGPITRSKVAELLNQSPLPSISTASSTNTTIATSTTIKKKHRRGGGGGNNDDEEEEESDTTAPALPTSLAVNAGDATASITWNDPADSDLATISIYRGTVSGSLTLLATTSAAVETYTDVPIANDTTYYYTLSATDTAGNESSQTSEVSDTPVGLYDIYVDSVAGDDSNDGTSDYEALATLSAVQTAATAHGDGVRIGLKRDSVWREKLDISTIQSVIISEYGSSGDLPLIDAANLVTSWTKTAGYTNVYQSSTTPESGEGSLSMTEDEVLMPWKTSIAQVDAQPGSWYASSYTGAATIYIHASDSSSPITNAKTYRVNNRLQSLNMVDSDDSTVEGVHASQGFGASGPFRQGQGVNVSRILTSNAGGKHHTYFESGTTTDSIAYGNDVAHYDTNVMWVAFLPTNDGPQRAFYNRVGAVLPANQNGVADAFYAHTSPGVDVHEKITYQQSWTTYTSGFGGHAEVIDITGSYAYNAAIAGGNSGAATGTIRYTQAWIASTTIARSLLAPQGVGTVVQDSVLKSDSTGSGVGIYSDSTSSNDVAVTDSIIDYKGGNIYRNYYASSTQALRVNNSILKAGAFYQFYILNTGQTYTGDYNIFVEGSVGFRAVKGATTYTTLSSWRTATGADTNSITITSSQYDSLFPNKASGDWTMADIGVTFVDGTLLSEAGPQYHWDWNDREAQSGPPTSWPNVPDTLEESKEYVSDPEDWVF